jgi:hypothetical protein
MYLSLPVTKSFSGGTGFPACTHRVAGGDARRYETFHDLWVGQRAVRTVSKSLEAGKITGLRASSNFKDIITD